MNRNNMSYVWCGDTCGEQTLVACRGHPKINSYGSFYWKDKLKLTSPRFLGPFSMIPIKFLSYFSTRRVNWIRNTFEFWSSNQIETFKKHFLKKCLQPPFYRRSNHPITSKVFYDGWSSRSSRCDCRNVDEPVCAGTVLPVRSADCTQFCKHLRFLSSKLFRYYPWYKHRSHIASMQKLSEVAQRSRKMDVMRFGKSRAHGSLPFECQRAQSSQRKWTDHSFDWCSMDLDRAALNEIEGSTDDPKRSSDGNNFTAIVHRRFCREKSAVHWMPSRI